MGDEHKLQTEGRKENAAQTLNASRIVGGAERYPAVRQHDAIERTGRTEQVAGEGRSFDPGKDAPSQPSRGAGDTPSPGTDEGRLGPAGDPAEGKR
jgi:hypothetical protein